MDHRERFVFSANTWPLEQTIEWAAAHDFRWVDFNADVPANYPASFTGERLRAIRGLAAREGIILGLHTLSAVNMAEITPVMHAAADTYLRENLHLASALGCQHVIVHGGYHFSSDRDNRLAVALDRLLRASAWAQDLGVDLFFENHNREPDNAEIHYLPRDLAETKYFFDRIPSPRFRWAFNIGHAHLVADGFDGFLDGLGVARLGQVRLNDTHGRYEEHLVPGQGIVNFAHVFHRLTAAGYAGPFSLDFGTPDDKATWRDRFAALLADPPATP